MRILLTTGIAILFCLQTVFAREKAEELRALSDSASYGIIKFNASGYDHFILNQPRPYDLLILYTVTSSCEICDAVLSEFQTVVYSYRKDNMQFPGEKRRAVFFGTLYYDRENERIFRQHGINSVPTIAFTSPKNVKNNRINEDDIWTLKGDVAFDADKIMDFINKRTGLSVKTQITLTHQLTNMVIMGAILIVGVFLVKILKDIIINPTVWFVGSCAVFIICVGGVVYSIIHGVPWFKLERTQSGAVVVAEYVNRGQRNQWAGEGFMASGLMVIICLCMMFLYNFDKFKKLVNIRVGIAIGLIATVISLNLLLSIYRLKAPWYAPSFWPPDNYIKG